MKLRLYNSLLALIAGLSVAHAEDLTPQQFDTFFETPNEKSLGYYPDAYKRQLITFDKFTSAVRYALLQKAEWVAANIDLTLPAMSSLVEGDVADEQLLAIRKISPYLYGWRIFNKGSDAQRATLLRELAETSDNSIEGIVKNGGASEVFRRLNISVKSMRPWDELILAQLLGDTAAITDSIEIWYEHKNRLELLKDDEQLYKKFAEHLEILRAAKAAYLREVDKQAPNKSRILKALWDTGEGLQGSSNHMLMLKFLLPENTSLEDRLLATGLTGDVLITRLTGAGEGWLVEKIRPGIWKELSAYMIKNPTLLKTVPTQVLNKVSEKLVAEKLYDELKVLAQVLLEASINVESYEYALYKLAEAELFQKNYEAGLEYTNVLYKNGPLVLDREAVDRLTVQLKYLRGDFTGAYTTILEMYARRPASLDPELASRLAALSGNSFESQLFKYMGEFR